MKIEPKGTEEEMDLFIEVEQHYQMAKDDLDRRRPDFDRKDILFRSHIDERKWPYQSVIFDPRTYSVISEQTARQFVNKPRAHLEPRESGDTLGAAVCNELLSFQWDDNVRADGAPMLAKWAMMDLNARKYGASFALAPWRYQRKAGKIFFDGPNFQPWPNRDVLHNPSYPVIKHWIQLRDYVTVSELENINDSRKKAAYKNLDLLKKSMSESDMSSDTRDYVIKNKSIKGLQDFLGKDLSNKVLERITEYRDERKIVFIPKHGIVIQDIPNPYAHQEIPVVHLKYSPLDDDIYGISKIEPLERLQLALNAYINQNMDALNLMTYTPLKIRKGGGAVEMHTIRFLKGAKWLMENPETDVIPHLQGNHGVQEFPVIYRIMVGAFLEAAGESSTAVSNANPGNAQKTAAEITDTAVTRSALDAFNQMFLGQAMSRQMMFWQSMNKQFLFNNANKQKVIRISGSEAIQYFQERGLDQNGLQGTQQEHQALSDPTMAGIITPQDMSSPLYPVTVKGKVQNKMTMDGKAASLVIEKEDLDGNYDYVVDIASMSQGASDKVIQAKSDFISRVMGVDPATGRPSGFGQALQAEGKKIKAEELIVDYAHSIGFRNAEYYIESLPQPTQVQDPNAMQLSAGQVGANPAIPAQPVNPAPVLPAQPVQ